MTVDGRFKMESENEVRVVENIETIFG